MRGLGNPFVYIYIYSIQQCNSVSREWDSVVNGACMLVRYTVHKHVAHCTSCALPDLFFLCSQSQPPWFRTPCTYFRWHFRSRRCRLMPWPLPGGGRNERWSRLRIFKRYLGCPLCLPLWHVMIRGWYVSMCFHKVRILQGVAQVSCTKTLEDPLFEFDSGMIHTYVYLYIYICICVFIYEHINDIYVSIYIYHLLIYLFNFFIYLFHYDFSLSIHLFFGIYVCMYACMYVCLHMYVLHMIINFTFMYIWYVYMYIY